MAIDFDPTESAGEVRAYQEANDFRWAAATTHVDVIRAFRVTSQDTKIGLGSDGVIRFREGYGVLDRIWWEQALSDLTER